MSNVQMVCLDVLLHVRMNMNTIKIIILQPWDLVLTLILLYELDKYRSSRVVECAATVSWQRADLTYKNNNLNDFRPGVAGAVLQSPV